MQEIQERRQDKLIPNARQLHEYVNLYFDAHNPMLSKCRAHNDSICVLRVNHIVVDLSGVIVTDKNAAKDYVRFYAAPQGLQALNKDLVFAQFWLNRDDPFDEQYRRGVKCAEVLVPDSVSPDLIIGAYVANQRALAAFMKLGTRLSVVVNGSMFF
jgi:ssDNA thymidine ADP-ribosyltransferase, DarT